MAQRLIRMREVTHRVGLQKTAIYRRIQRGEFPRPIKVGRASGWIEIEVEQWISATIAANRTFAQ